jgi:imidazolonepropionase-like amidohydrolase
LVREGLVADLIVVDGDPVQDSDALRRLRLVMHEGVLHPLPQAVRSAAAVS